MVTLRAKEELNKTESFGSQKQGPGFSLCTVNFAMIAKIRYHRENSVIAKIEIFAMHSNFRYDSEFLL